MYVPLYVVGVTELIKISYIPYNYNTDISAIVVSILMKEVCHKLTFQSYKLNRLRTKDITCTCTICFDV